MKKTIYAVASGEYSDYGIVALFDERPDAEALVAEMNLTRPIDPAFIQEFPLYAAGDRSLRRRHYFVGHVFVTAEGAIDGEPEIWANDVLADKFPRHPAAQVTRTGQGMWRIVKQGSDTTRVRKALREKAAWVATEIVEGRDPLGREVA